MIASAFVSVLATLPPAPIGEPHASAAAAAVERWDEVDELVARLRSDRTLERKRAAETLGALGDGARRAVPDLVDRLDVEDKSLVRAAIAEALGAIGHRQGIVALRARMAEERSSRSREAMVRALGRGGRPSDARAVVPLLEDDDVDVFAAAVEAIERLDTGVLPEALGELARDARAELRERAIAALAERDGAAEVLAALLADEDEDVRAGTASALAGHATPALVDPLLALLDDPLARVRAAAAEAFTGLASEAERVVPALVPLLHDPAADVRICAARALVSLRAAGVEPLARSLHASAAKEPVLAVLLGIGRHSEDALRAALEDAELRPELVDVLLERDSWSLGSAEPLPVDPLLRVALLLAALRRPDDRAEIVRALRRETNENVPRAEWGEVAGAVDASRLEPGLRSAVRLVLHAQQARRFESEGPTVIPDPGFERGWHEPVASETELLALFDDADSDVRETAAWLCGLDATASEPERARLEAALADRDSAVRSTAAWALGFQAVAARYGDWIPSWVAGANAPYHNELFEGDVIRIRGGRESFARRPGESDEQWGRRLEVERWRLAAREEPEAHARRVERADWLERVAPALERLVADAHQPADVRKSAAWALARAELLEPHCAAALEACLVAPDVEERVRAAEAILRSGVRDEVSRKLLVERASEGDRQACWALARIGDEWSVRVLLDLLERSEPRNWQFASCLAGVRPPPRAAIEPLGARLRDGYSELAAWLVLLGADGVPELVRALDASRRDVRGAAIFALARLGADAAPALDALERIAAGSDATLAQAARESLATIRARLEER